MENSGKIERSAGILMHISSLPSPFGIGTFGKTAYEFVDFVAQARHRYWQVLPLGPTTYGDSPYQSYSAFAGNPYFVDLEMLTDDGILDRNIYEDIDWAAAIMWITKKSTITGSLFCMKHTKIIDRNSVKAV